MAIDDLPGLRLALDRIESFWKDPYTVGWSLGKDRVAIAVAKSWRYGQEMAFQEAGLLHEWSGPFSGETQSLKSRDELNRLAAEMIRSDQECLERLPLRERETIERQYGAF